VFMRIELFLYDVCHEVYDNVMDVVIEILGFIPVLGEPGRTQLCMHRLAVQELPQGGSSV